MRPPAAPLPAHRERVGVRAVRALNLARTGRRELDDALGIVLRHEARAGHQHRIGDRVQVGRIERQQDNRQVALQVLFAGQ